MQNFTFVSSATSYVSGNAELLIVSTIDAEIYTTRDRFQ